MQNVCVYVCHVPFCCLSHPLLFLFSSHFVVSPFFFLVCCCVSRNNKIVTREFVFGHELAKCIFKFILKNTYVVVMWQWAFSETSDSIWLLLCRSCNTYCPPARRWVEALPPQKEIKWHGQKHIYSCVHGIGIGTGRIPECVVARHYITLNARRKKWY